MERQVRTPEPVGKRLGVSEINRDSGCVTDSPQSTRRSFGTDNISKRDSGVHLRDWTENTPRKQEGVSEYNETGARLLPESSKDEAKTTTPSTRFKPLLDSETPKLRTPAHQDKSPDLYGMDQTKHTTDPEKTSSKSPSKYPGIGGLASAALVTSSSPSPSPSTPTPQAQGQRSVSDIISRRQTPLADRQFRRTASITSLSRGRTTPESPNFRVDSPSARSIRSSGTNTPPLRRVDRRISGDVGSLSHNTTGGHSHSHTDPSSSSTTNHLPISTASSSSAAAFSSNVREKEKEERPIAANEGRVRAKEMADVYVSHETFIN